MSVRILFIFLVLFLLVGCAGDNAADQDPDGDDGEGGELGDTGIDDVFSDDDAVEPPPAPS